jgi:hypothetical protein
MVNKHEQQILDNALAKVTAETRRSNEQLLEEQVTNAWKNDMNAFLAGLIGPRFVGGVSGDSSSSPSGGASTTPRGSLSSSKDPFAASITLRPSNTNDHNAWIRSRSLVPYEQRQVAVDPRFVVGHWEVIKDTHTRHPQDTVESLKNLVTQASAGASNQDPVLNGYSTALDLVSSLLQAKNLSSPIDLACRTVVHFCKQFEDMIKIKVQTAINTGAIQESTGYTQEGARLCELYVKLILGPKVDVWALLYYSLRIGDAKAAYEIFMNRPPSEISEQHKNSIQKILYNLSLGENLRLWEQGMVSIPLVDREVLKELANHEHAPNSVHFKGVFALLTGYADLPIDPQCPGFCDMEDSLFGGIWKALLEDGPMTALESFGKNIRGVAYDYKDERSGDWPCVLLLLAAQQYASAMWHLAETGNDVLLQAAHLTIILTEANVAISDLGDPSTFRDIASQILDKYANALLVVLHEAPMPPVVLAADYLLCIKDQVLCDKAIASLIVKLEFPEDLVGQITQDGLPSSFSHLAHGLQNHPRFVTILSKAAEIGKTNPDNTAKVLTALKCYMMAQKYDGVLTLFKMMLSPPDDPPSDKRNYWLEQADGFFRHCIESRGVVYGALENNKQLGLVDACRTLIGLNRFFACLKNNLYGDAGKIIFSLGLVPRSRYELDAMVTQFRDRVDDSVRRCYPKVLLGVMDVLAHQHSSLKRSFESGTESVVMKEMKDLQAQASLLIQFAGLIDTDEFRRSQLSEKQALMI